MGVPGDGRHSGRGGILGSAGQDRGQGRRTTEGDLSLRVWIAAFPRNRQRTLHKSHRRTRRLWRAGFAPSRNCRVSRSPAGLTAASFPDSPFMKSKPARKRLDVLLVERGLAGSRQKAQAMILAGEISVNGARAEKAGMPVEIGARIEVMSRLQKYASRGGLKLEGALDDFGQDVAARVYAVDVNVGQLAWKLQQDPRVVPVERNARDLRPSDVPEAAELVVIDVSFISVAKVLGPAVAASKPGAEFLVLIKPQFELRREEVGAGGIVKDAELHEKAIASVSEKAEAAGLELLGVKGSRLPGAEGNQEYFLRARKRG